MYDYKIWNWTLPKLMAAEFQVFVTDGWEPFMMTGSAENLVVMFRRPVAKVT